MAGPRVAQVGEVWKVRRPSYFTLVEYRDTVTSSRWPAIQTDALGRRPRGAVLNLDSSDFIEPTGYSSVIPGRVYRRNLRLEQEAPRQCVCNCCEHLHAGVNELPALWLHRRGESRE